jgi:hypothetical protein
LFTIAQDLTKRQVQADVDQSDIGRVKVGQIARFTVDAYPTKNSATHLPDPLQRAGEPERRHVSGHPRGREP